MLTARIVVAIAAIVVGVAHWVAAVDHRGTPPPSAAEPKPLEPVLLTGPDADVRRRDLLRRAALRLGAPQEAAVSLDGAVTSCHFVQDAPSGTTPKFTCALEDGELVKVKYGREPEIHAEAAATRLLTMLGYPSDQVRIVPRLRCYGCPRYPFAGAYVLANPVTRRLLAGRAATDGYTDFEWVSIERRFPARPVETATAKGWHWWELADANSDATGRRRADVDALKLLAAFLAHWDNKAENQRLVCLDSGAAATAKAAGDPENGCRRPLAMIQDLGATFGPMKVNLARWRDLPVWHDRATCTLSMRSLPYRGASFIDAVITEPGRAQLAARLEALTDAEVRALFAGARFPQYQTATDDEKDLEAWTAAFRHRADQIVHARCP